MMTSGFKRRHVPAKEAGAGLIEVLVAVVVLAVGLLGMAGLQASALRGNQSSYARSQAVMLSYYMLDMMRADRNRAVLGDYNTDNNATPGAVLTPVCNPADLSANTLADNARQDWLTTIKAGLGDAAQTCGAIRCDVSGECTIQITWDDERAGGSGQQRFETRSRL